MKTPSNFQTYINRSIKNKSLILSLLTSIFITTVTLTVVIVSNYREISTVNRMINGAVADIKKQQNELAPPLTIEQILIRNYPPVYDVTVSKPQSSVSESFYFIVEYSKLGLELNLIIQSKNTYKIGLKSSYVTRWMKQNRLFNTYLPSVPVDIDSGISEELKLASLSNNNSFKFSKDGGIYLNSSELKMALFSFILLWFSLFLIINLYLKSTLSLSTLRKLSKQYLFEMISKKAISIKFQPIINITNKRLTSLECLCRINNANDQAPDCIKYLDDEICFELLKFSFTTIREYNDKGVYLRSNTYSINMLPGSIIKYAKHPIWRQHASINNLNIIIEIAESKLNADVRGALNEAIKKLKKMGYRFMIDRFGSSQASIYDTLILPIDYIKIDRSIVENVNHKKNYDFLMSVVNFCHKNNIRVVAEGVSKESHRDTLGEIGIIFQQGFLYGKAQSLSLLLSKDHKQDFYTLPYTQ
ncbi:EAL domain-containing protein [Shewanella sp. 30m-9]